MTVHYWPERQLSAKAQDLVEFDIASLRLVLSGAHQETPQLWLVSCDQYENNGRILRDSTSPRLLAYSQQTQTLYATDGCNSCVHALHGDIQMLSRDRIETFATESEIELRFLEKLVSLLESNAASTGAERS